MRTNINQTRKKAKQEDTKWGHRTALEASQINTFPKLKANTRQVNFPNVTTYKKFL